MIIQNIDFNIEAIKGFDEDSFTALVEGQIEAGSFPRSFNAKKAWKELAKTLPKPEKIEVKVFSPKSKGKKYKSEE